MKLDKYDTVRLLITKGWEHKAIPKFTEESILNYSKRIFSYQCAITPSYLDVVSIWVAFARDVFEISDYRMYLELVCMKSYDPVSAIITVIQCMEVVGRFELDEQDIKK